MFDLFDSLKREFRQEITPVRDALQRIETRLDRQVADLEKRVPPQAA